MAVELEVFRANHYMTEPDLFQVAQCRLFETTTYLWLALFFFDVWLLIPPVA